MNLAIISHTEHYRDDQDHIVGWGPTVNEINHLLDVFENIYHLAMLYEDTPAPPSSARYSSEKISFIPIPSVGGPTVSDKLKIVLNSVKTVKTVHNVLKKVDCFQMRTPTGIAVFMIPYLSLFVKKKGWFKYAGNWQQTNGPLGYRFQRSLLKAQKRVVTINGSWKNQPEHCLSFENPCLELSDIEEGNVIRQKKTYDNGLEFCYVGRLESSKGVKHIIEAMDMLTDAEKNRIKIVHLVGDGDELEYFKSLSKKAGVEFKFYGFLSRKQVIEIYKKSHVFIMPTTASEGFPKVIAEAMNFGCIPVVSNVSSIGQYVTDMKTGILIEPVSNENVRDAVLRLLNLGEENYKELINNFNNVTNKFTYSYYNERIENDILKIQ